MLYRVNPLNFIKHLKSVHETKLINAANKLGEEAEIYFKNSRCILCKKSYAKTKKFLRINRVTFTKDSKL